MPDANKMTSSPSDDGDEYEILPEREIQDLKSELQKLKDFEIMPSKKMGVQLVELNTKLDKLLSIFEEATTALQMEEGGLSFKDKMKPLAEKMNKILEQNSEIAQGIVAVADLVKDLREDLGKGVNIRESEIAPPAPASYPAGQFSQPMMPQRTMPQPMQGMRPMPGMPPPPPPARRRRFGP
jgi:DNA repair exonuclease SbcCD ATPase subunit